jgi:hypothetical protein
VLTKPDRERGERDHRWPEFLPGGGAVLFTITPFDGSIDNAQIAVLDLQTGTSKVLIRGGSDAHFRSPESFRSRSFDERGSYLSHIGT